MCTLCDSNPWTLLYIKITCCFNSRKYYFSMFELSEIPGILINTYPSKYLFGSIWMSPSVFEHLKWQNYIQMILHYYTNTLSKSPNMQRLKSIPAGCFDLVLFFQKVSIRKTQVVCCIWVASQTRPTSLTLITSVMDCDKRKSLTTAPQILSLTIELMRRTAALCLYKCDAEKSSLPWPWASMLIQQVNINLYPSLNTSVSHSFMSPLLFPSYSSTIESLGKVKGLERDRLRSGR